MRRLSILALAPNSWHGPWLNRQQLLSRLGRRHHIVYSTGPRRSDFGGRSPHPNWLPRTSRDDNVLLDLLPRWMAAAVKNPRFHRVMVRLLARRWNGLLRTGDPVVVWCFHPKFWPYVLRLNPDRLVYHAYDLYHLQGGHWDDRRKDQEQKILRRADLVVASSPQIAAYLTSRGAQNPLVVENAADYIAFAIEPGDTPDPPRLAVIPGPRIGYTGALNRKVDFPLFAWLASRHPRWQFVLIGEVGNLDTSTAAAVAQLKLMPNVHFLGFQPYQDLPQYVNRMDVNLLAYRLDSDVWSEGIYPLKLHEYLAAGRSIVSADLPSVRGFHNVIRIAKSPEEWEAAITLALQDNGQDAVRARRSVASQNDWDARVQVLEGKLEGLFGPRTDAPETTR